MTVRSPNGTITAVPGFIRSVSVNPRVEVNRDCFPFTLPVLHTFETLDLHPEMTFFVGENGSGKSTLLEAIAVNYGLPAEGGSRHHTFSTHDSHSDLWDNIVLAKPDYPKEAVFLRAETFYTMATYLHQAALDGRSPPRFGWSHIRSHGEGFLETVSSFKPPGLYLFDEPESALSVQGQITFLAHMKQFVDAGSQCIIATHSPILMGFGRGKICHFTDDGIHEIGYHDTPHYRLTLDFLRNRERYSKLLGLDEGSES